MKILEAIAFTAFLSSCVDPPDELDTLDSAITVPAGVTYQIQNMGGECIDVPSFARTSGVALQSHACKLAGYLGNQQFTMEAVTGGFRLRGFDSQRCLDLPNSSTADGTIVQQSECHSGQNQIWNIADEVGYVRITSALDVTKCIHVDAAHAVRLSRCASVTQSARSFGFTRARTSVSFHNQGLCLDLPSYTTHLVQPQRFTCKTPPVDTTNQEWNLEPTAAGTFALRSRSSNMCLEVWGDREVVQSPCRPAHLDQQWRFLQQTASLWKVQSVDDGKCFLVSNNLLYLFPCIDAPEAMFDIEPGAF